MRVSSNRYLVFLLIGFVLLLLAACSAPKSPGDAVQQIFDAYRQGNQSAVDKLMSEEGKENASSYCDGTAITCLERNYGRKGDLISSSVTVISEDDDSASVELRTSWTERDRDYCQTFVVDKVGGSWGVTYFDEPGGCG